MFKKYPADYNTFTEFSEGNEKANRKLYYLLTFICLLMTIFFIFRWHKGEGGIFGAIFWGIVTFLMPRGIPSNKERRAEFFEELFRLYPELASPYFTFEEADYLDRRLGLMIYGEHLIAYVSLTIIDLTSYDGCYWYNGRSKPTGGIIFTSTQSGEEMPVSIMKVRGASELRNELYDYLEENFDIKFDANRRF